MTSQPSTIARSHERRHLKLLQSYPSHSISTVPLSFYAPAAAAAAGAPMKSTTSSGVSPRQAQNLMFAYSAAGLGVAYLVHCNFQSNASGAHYGGRAAGSAGPLGGPVRETIMKSLGRAAGGVGGRAGGGLRLAGGAGAAGWGGVAGGRVGTVGATKMMGVVRNVIGVLRFVR